MPWKKKADNSLETDASGNPIWVSETDNSEKPVPSISALNNEARGFRERAEAAETNLAAFKGLDPAKAREALELTKNIEIGKLIDKGKLDEATAAIAAQFSQQIAEKDKAIADLGNARAKDKIDLSFAGSTFIKEKINVPLSMFQAAFADKFSLDANGQIIARDPVTGNTIYGDDGKPASFDYALAYIVDKVPERNQILKAPNSSGTGNNGAGGNATGDLRTMRRADYESKAPAEKAAIAKEMQAGKVQLVND